MAVRLPDQRQAWERHQAASHPLPTELHGGRPFGIRDHRAGERVARALGGSEMALRANDVCGHPSVDAPAVTLHRDGLVEPQSLMKTIETARLELGKVLAALQVLPLAYLASLRGVAPLTHLQDVTGLSRSRLSNRSQTLNSSTRLRIREHADEASRTNLKSAGLSEAEIETAMHRVYQVKDAGGGFWAEIWIALDDAVKPMLGECAECGRGFDQLLEQAATAVKADDPRTAATAFSDYASQWSGDAEVDSAPLGVHAAHWAGAVDWVEVERLSRELLEHALFDQFAHVDAVWGALFFRRFAPRPIFRFVMPTWSGERGVHRPARRLLEFSYAACHWAAHKRWPNRAPRAADIALALGVDNSVVSNYFDGTKRLRYKQFEPLWADLQKHFGFRDDLPLPYPLVAAAICWQHQLVTVSSTHKVESLILVGDAYENMWRWRSSRMTAQSSGKEPWAEWLTA